jgi:hypothetical protein
MLLREAGEVFWAGWIVAQEQYGGFGERPLEVGMAKLLTGAAVALAGRRFGAVDEPAIGDARLHAREPLAIMDFIQQHEGQALAAPRNRAQALDGLRIMRVGRLDEIQLSVGAQAIIGANQCASHCDALLNGRLGEPLCHTVSETWGVDGKRRSRQPLRPPLRG